MRVPERIIAELLGQRTVLVARSWLVSGKGCCASRSRPVADAVRKSSHTVADPARTKALSETRGPRGPLVPPSASRYGQLSRSVSNSTVTVPSECTVTWATKCSVIREPSEPLTLMWPVNVAVKVLVLEFSPSQKVALPV